MLEDGVYIFSESGALGYVNSKMTNLSGGNSITCGLSLIWNHLRRTRTSPHKATNTSQFDNNTSMEQASQKL